MKYHHHTLKDSFLFLMERRPQIWPNEGFLVQLLRYESELTPTYDSSMKMTVVDENSLDESIEFRHEHNKDE
jgi:hypothetical protein